MDVVTLESRKIGEKYHDFCIDEAIFHINKAHEALKDGLADPAAWYATSRFTAGVLAKCLPFIVAVQMQESLAEDQESSSGES